MNVDTGRGAGYGLVMLLTLVFLGSFVVGSGLGLIALHVTLTRPDRK